METQDITRHYYYKDDFMVLCPFPTGQRPDYPWRMVFNTGTNPYYCYTIAFDGENYTRAKPVEGTADSVWLEFKRHQFMPGKLAFEFRREAPNALFADGEQFLATPVVVDIELWEKPSDDDPTPPTLVGVIERAVKGDKGDRGDVGETGLSAYASFMANNPECPLTQEQYAAAPIVAAERVEQVTEQVIERAGQFEAQIKLAEDKRVAGESGRAQEEILRAEAEAKREVSEGKRLDNELARTESEALRQDATASAIEHTTTAATSASEAAVRADAAVAGIPEQVEQAVDALRVVETIPGAVATLDVLGGHTYLCGTLTALTLRTVENAPQEAVIRFRSGGSGVTLTLPNTLALGHRWVIPADTLCEINIVSNSALIALFYV